MTQRIDPYDLFNPDLPDVWEPVPEEYKPLLIVRGNIASKTQERMINAIVASRWYFLKNDFTDSYGNRVRCKHCNRIHDYVTMRCVDAPFNSLTEVIGIIRRGDGEYVDASNNDFFPEEYKSLEIDAQTMGMIEPISVRRAYDHIRMIRQRGERIYPHIP